MSGHTDALIIIILVLVLAILAGNFSSSFNLYDVNFLNLAYFFNRLLAFFTGGFDLPLTGWLTRLLIWLVLVSVILLASIVYFLTRINRLRQEDRLRYAAVLPSELEAKPYRNARWENLKTYLESENESDWKLAIIEADKLLDEMVTKMGYPGDNLGERLKAVEPSDFQTLQAAWEAHRLRNRIAHEAGFQLTRREAHRAIGLFEKVFREFNYI